MWFRGQEVVCIQDDWWKEYIIPGEILPVVGQILRIRSIKPSDKYVGLYAFRFHEIHNPVRANCNLECMFLSDAFRPVIRLKDEEKIKIKEKV